MCSRSANEHDATRRDDGTILRSPWKQEKNLVITFVRLVLLIEKPVVHQREETTRMHSTARLSVDRQTRTDFFSHRSAVLSILIRTTNKTLSFFPPLHQSFLRLVEGYASRDLKARGTRVPLTTDWLAAFSTSCSTCCPFKWSVHAIAYSSVTTKSLRKRAGLLKENTKNLPGLHTSTNFSILLSPYILLLLRVSLFDRLFHPDFTLSKTLLLADYLVFVEIS